MSKNAIPMADGATTMEIGMSTQSFRRLLNANADRNIRTIGLHILSRVPVLVWGDPGVGKTATVLEIGRLLNQPVKLLIGSWLSPQDFGFPVVGEDVVEVDGRAYRCIDLVPPRLALELWQGGGILFVDEATTVPPALQAPMLSLLQGHRFGELQLDPAKVAIVAAANPPEQAASGFDLAPPMANRFSHVEFHLDRQGWARSFPSYWDHPPKVRIWDYELDEGVWAQTRALVASFIHKRPELLLELPKDAGGQGQAWPSPRTWDYASRGLAVVEQEGGSEEDAYTVVIGAVGEGPAHEFMSYRRELDLPDPEEVLKKADKFKLPERGDKAYAVLQSVTMAVKSNFTPERLKQGLTIMKRAAEQGGVDIGAICIGTLIRLYDDRRDQLDGLDLAPFIKPYIPALKEAGIISW